MWSVEAVLCRDQSAFVVATANLIQSFLHLPNSKEKIMFQELMPLLAQRILLVTLSRVSDENISANVIPKPLKADQGDDEGALSTALSLIGTPQELDEQLPRLLGEFVETHLGLSSTLKSAKEQMEAAARTAREVAKKSTNSKSHNGPGRNATPSPAQVQEVTESKRRAGDSESDASRAPVPAGLGTATGNLFETENDQ
jgi:PRTRC genetic system protein E